MQVGIELLADGIDGLHPLLAQEILQLLLHHRHPDQHRRAFRRTFGLHHAHLEVVHDRQQPFEQGGVGVLHGVVLLALETLAGVFQVGALAQGLVAVPGRVRPGALARVSSTVSDSRAACPGRAGGLALRFGRGRFAVDAGGRVFGSVHSLRITISVMSSFCGCSPAKLRRSSVNRLTMAGAPSGALACTA